MILGSGIGVFSHGLLINWLIVINIISFIVYTIDGIAPQVRVKLWILLLLPVLGGSIGACLGNYFFNTCFRHSIAEYKFLIHYLPGTVLIVELLGYLYLKYGSDFFSDIIKMVREHSGVFGYYLLIVGVITFILQLIYDTQYYWLSVMSEGLPIRIMVVLIIIGGAPFALVEKLLFNFKYSNPTDCTKGPENFIYGIGVWIFALIWIVAIAYFVFGVNLIELVINRLA